MNKGWVIKKLGEVSAINYGYTESASIEPVGPRFLRITDIQNDRVDWESVPYCMIESADLPKYRLASGDIVFARTGATTGKSFLVNDPPDAVFASYLIRLRLLDKKLLPEFLSLFFQTASYWKSIKEGSSGSAQGGFNATKLGALFIPVPPLPEQQRIVGILDKAFESIATAKANAEKNLQNARALFDSHLQSVFTQRGEGWVDRRLGDIAETQYGLSEPMNEEGKGFKIFRMGEVQGGRLIDTGRMKYADINRSEFEKYKLQSGDVLFNRTNSYELVGKTGMFDSPGDYCFASYLIRVLLNPNIMHTAFLNHFMNSERFQNSVKQKASKSINQANINATILSNEFVRFPESLIEQQIIVARLDSLREETLRLESIFQQKLAALEELKKSLLQQAFAGEF